MNARPGRTPRNARSRTGDPSWTGDHGAPRWPGGGELRDLTAYFITTGRLHAREALCSLRAQSLERDIVVVRDVHPMHRAYAATLECATEYCVVLDDDVVLAPGVVPGLFARFRRVRRDDPRAYLMTARIFIEVKGRFGSGGFKMFHVPSLRRVGWPDEPHVMFAQRERAEALGLRRVQSGVEAGVQRAGSDLDVYKKYLWMSLRSRAGQLRAPTLEELLAQARETNDRRRWLACLGCLDARALDPTGSKDERIVGPLAREVDISRATTNDLSLLVEDAVAVRADG